MKKLLSNFFIFTGIFFVIISIALYWQSNNPNRLKFDNYVAPQGTQIVNEVSQPVRLIIPNLDIDLAVIPAEKTGDKWPTTSQGVSYLNSSPVPGEVGNSILYGHNWASILGNLRQAVPGHQIVIAYADGSTKVFEVINIQKVDPNQTEVLNQTGDARITLYTCTGFLDRERLVVTAKLL